MGKFANNIVGSAWASMFPGQPAVSDFILLGDVPFAIFYAADFGTNALTGGNDILLIAVPEPSRALLITVATLGLVTFRRRRR